MPRSNLREKYKYERRGDKEIGMISRGFFDEKGRMHGTAIFYNIDGSLYVTGTYESNSDFLDSGQIGHWKYFKNDKELRREIIFIK